MNLHFSLVAYLIIDLAKFLFAQNCITLGLLMIYLEYDSLSCSIYLPYLK
jgi:hypothetical protein